MRDLYARKPCGKKRPSTASQKVEYFRLRSRCCVERAAWRGLLEDAFVHAQPRLPYRPQHNRPVAENDREVAGRHGEGGLRLEASDAQRVFLVGVDAYIADMCAARSAENERGEVRCILRNGARTLEISFARASLASPQVGDLEFALLEGSAHGILHDEGMGGGVAMFQWTMRSRRRGVAVVGGGRARFSQGMRILAMDIVFDVHGFMEQLYMAGLAAEAEAAKEAARLAAADSLAGERTHAAADESRCSGYWDPVQKRRRRTTGFDERPVSSADPATKGEQDEPASAPRRHSGYWDPSTGRRRRTRGFDERPSADFTHDQSEGTLENEEDLVLLVREVAAAAAEAEAAGAGSKPSELVVVG